MKTTWGISNSEGRFTRESEAQQRTLRVRHEMQCTSGSCGCSKTQLRGGSTAATRLQKNESHYKIRDRQSFDASTTPAPNKKGEESGKAEQGSCRTASGQHGRLRRCGRNAGPVAFKNSNGKGPPKSPRFLLILKQSNPASNGGGDNAEATPTPAPQRKRDDRNFCRTIFATREGTTLFDGPYNDSGRRPGKRGEGDVELRNREKKRARVTGNIGGIWTFRQSRDSDWSNSALRGQPAGLAVK